MVDVKVIKEKLAEMQQSITKRVVEAKADVVVALYESKNRIGVELEKLRQQRNEVAAQMKSALPDDMRQQLIDLGKSLKENIAKIEQEWQEISQKFEQEIAKIPNFIHPDVPSGHLDEHNREIKRVGMPRQFDFEVKDHVQLGQELDLIDFDAGAKVSGPKFYFLKNQAVLLEWALVRYAMDILAQNGFTLYQTPDIAKEEILTGIGFAPRGSESNIYPLEGTGTCLVGTAEITLGGYYADQLIDMPNGSILMGGVSHCFRREAGAAGQFSRGLYRVHQFTKVEMFVICHPDESEEWHNRLCSIEEQIYTSLGIPYRVVDVCAGSLGAPAYRKYDIEAWMPARGEHGEYGEVTSTSNCTDYQSRRLNIRFKDNDGKNKYVHTLNGTAIAVSRAMVAILENYQCSDGSIEMPEVLHPYLGFTHIFKGNTVLPS
jgi:seryl-tRNA synthetase